MTIDSSSSWAVFFATPSWLAWISMGPLVWMPLLGLGLGLGVACGLYHRRTSRLVRHRAQQESFAARLLENQESERKRIAADLHDGLGQNLVLIKNRVVLALNAREKNEAEFQLAEIARVAGESIEEMRKISRNLRPYQLDRLGLTKAMQALVKQAGQTSPVEFQMRMDRVDNLFPAEVEINLYRILQEALTNVIKHSGATRAEISMRRVASGLKLVIEDNGRGFSSGITQDTGFGKHGMGLTTMKERTRIVNGQLGLTTGSGSIAGVRLEVFLPYNKEEEASWRAPSKS